MSLQELSVHDVALRALPAIATAFIVHFSLRSTRGRRRFAPSLSGFLTWLSQLTDGMTTERMASLCAREWTPERASRIIAVLRRRSPEPSAAEVLKGISPERRAVAEPNVQLALDFLRGYRALCTALEQQRALDKAPKAIDARLGKLWAALQPELPYARHAEEWTRLGFQGQDPTTDLRGGGGLALCELLHLVAHRPTLCADLVEAWSDPASPTRRTQLRSLPLALTSIHATSWLKALLEDGLLERSLLAHGAPRGHTAASYTDLLPSYRHLFVELFEGFVAEWCASRPGAPSWSLHLERPAHLRRLRTLPLHAPAERCTPFRACRRASCTASDAPARPRTPPHAPHAPARPRTPAHACAGNAPLLRASCSSRRLPRPSSRAYATRCVAARRWLGRWPRRRQKRRATAWRRRRRPVAQPPRCRGPASTSTLSRARTGGSVWNGCSAATA